MVDENSIVNRRYTYIPECNCPVEAIDIHHVLVRRGKAKRFFIYLSVLIGLSISLFLVLFKYLIFQQLEKNPEYFKNESITILFWSAFLVKLLLWKTVEKALGVKLETHYLSGRIVHRFFPTGKILKPVLLECVTPISCYWSVSLVVCDEEELMLVFKIQPTVVLQQSKTRGQL